MRHSVTRFLGPGTLLLALLLTGCDQDRPVAEAPDTPQATAAAPQSADADPQSAGAAPSLNAAPSLDAGGGAPAASDPSVPSDPLIGSGSADPPPPDPLLASDPLKGRGMPTQHSHWLRGQIRDARVTVLLNGIRQGSYGGLVDKDITMKLRAGLNFVTFIYQPNTTAGDAQMEIVESEHTPPIPPLATFRSPQTADASPPAVHQTNTFIAK